MSVSNQQLQNAIKRYEQMGIYGMGAGRGNRGQVFRIG